MLSQCYFGLYNLVRENQCRFQQLFQYGFNKMRESWIREKQMEHNDNKDHTPHPKKTRYLIENTNNFQYYETLHLLVSQPLKHFALHAVILCGMIYFYILTFITGLIIYEINYVIVALHILVFILYLMLGFRNPGILLKISEDFQTNTKLQIPFDRDSKPAVNEMARSYAFPIKAHFITLKFCPQCLIYKPPRTVHCWTCNACIDRMDHHCPFIGTCVGKGNYQLFIYFITSLTFLLVLITAQLIILVIRLFQLHHLDGFKHTELYFAFALFVFTIVALMFVGSLGGFHVYLIVNGLTTNELCKDKWAGVSGNPFGKNFCLKNVFRFITGPTNEKIISPAQQLQRSMVPRFINKSEQYQSSSYSISQQELPSRLVKQPPSMPQKPQQTLQRQQGALTQQQFLKPTRIQQP